jgi:hypothetical protein
LQARPLLFAAGRTLIGQQQAQFGTAEVTMSAWEASLEGIPQSVMRGRFDEDEEEEKFEGGGFDFDEDEEDLDEDDEEGFDDEDDDFEDDEFGGGDFSFDEESEEE